MKTVAVNDDLDARTLEDLQQETLASASRATKDSLQRRLSGAGAVSFLAARRYAVVATTRPDGRPHAAMSGFLVVGRTIWLPVMRGTARARNLRAHPWVCVVIADGEGDEHTMVTFEGAALLVGRPPEAVLAAWARRHGTAPDWAAEWIRVDIERMLTYAGPGSAHEPG